MKIITVHILTGCEQAELTDGMNELLHASRDSDEKFIADWCYSAPVVEYDPYVPYLEGAFTNSIPGFTPLPATGGNLPAAPAALGRDSARCARSFLQAADWAIGRALFQARRPLQVEACYALLRSIRAAVEDADRLAADFGEGP